MGKKDKDVELAFKDHVSGQSNKPLTKPAHALPSDQVISEIHTNPDDGLTTTESRSRLDDYGRNEIGDRGDVNVTKILVRQVANAMILVLILAMAVSFGIGSYIEGGVVTAVIVLNIVIGFGQDYQGAYPRFAQIKQRYNLTSMSSREDDGLAEIAGLADC
jgi:Na+-exporting ATPase